jgi:hypothetical protein
MCRKVKLFIYNIIYFRTRLKPLIICNGLCPKINCKGGIKCPLYKHKLMIEKMNSKN